MFMQATSPQVKLGPFLRSLVTSDSSDKCSIVHGFPYTAFSPKQWVNLAKMLKVLSERPLSGRQRLSSYLVINNLGNHYCSSIDLLVIPL